MRNRMIVLGSRPVGEPTEANFRLIEEEEPGSPESGLLLKTLWLSLDLYMRSRMSDAKSYTAPTRIGEVLGGGTVSQILASRVDEFAVGDMIVGYTGWQEYARSDGVGLRKIDPTLAPISTALRIDLAQRGGEKGPQEWLSFFVKSPVTAPGHSQLHDLFQHQAFLHVQLRRHAEQVAALTTATKVG